MGFLDKIKVRTAVGRKNTFDLSCDHVTTQEMYNLRPVYSRELMPQQTIGINHSTFCRLAPMKKPFFGDVRIVNRAFFVPFRTVFPFFNDFMEDTTSNYNGSTIKVTTVPYISMYQLCQLFATETYGFAELTQDTSAYDFASDLGASQFYYYNFTNNGRVLMTILNSLGYTVDFSVDGDTHTNNIYMSALPLMSFAKIVADWYCNPQYSTRRDSIYKVFTTVCTGSNFTVANMVTLFGDIIYSLYDNDYFTSAFDNPVSPNDGLISGYTINDVTNDKTGSGYGSVVKSLSSSSTTEPSTPHVIGVSSAGSSNAPSYANTISQYVVDALKALTDFAKRHQLVGSQTLDRYLAEYGVKLDSDKLNRSVYLGKTVSNVQVSDVMNNTASNDESAPYLGDYAAKGVAFQENGGYNYTATEFGMIIVVSTVLPRVQYCQGINRRNLHLDRLDFFKGDFDALGVQAIAQGELFADTKSEENCDASNSAGYELKGVFGYTPRYSEYAVANNWLSGDFRFGSKNANLEQWHMFRMFDPTDSDEYDALIHSEDFCVGDPSQYNRIFSYDESDADHFFSVHHFNIRSSMPKKPLYEQYDFDGGREEMMNLGGTRLN